MMKKMAHFAIYFFQTLLFVCSPLVMLTQSDKCEFPADTNNSDSFNGEKNSVRNSNNNGSGSNNSRIFSNFLFNTFYYSKRIDDTYEEFADFFSPQIFRVELIYEIGSVLLALICTIPLIWSTVVWDDFFLFNF